MTSIPPHPPGAAPRTPLGRSPEPQPRLLRSVLLGFASLLGLLGVWAFAVALTQPDMPYFPADPARLNEAAAQDGPAQLAARLGVLRGDLWTDAAIAAWAAYAAAPAAQKAALRERLAASRAAAERAVGLAPHDARAWLVLAAAAAETKSAPAAVNALLKMSYYTGPNEPVLVPLRIGLATRAADIGEADLQTLAESDVRLMVREPKLRARAPTLYKEAGAAGRAFLERAIGFLDTGLREEMQRSVAN
jgi:hypothetical protein